MNKKMIRCTQEHRDRLLEYLKLESERNIFLIADIINYGFQNEIQSVWGEFEGDKCCAVYLWFCNNLLIYSHDDILELQSLGEIISMKRPDQVMAKRVHLEQVNRMLEGYEIKSRELLALHQSGVNEIEEVKDKRFACRIAEQKDVDTIYDFLQSGELAPLYRAKAMIENRIGTGEGVHYLIEDAGELVAQINSAASTPYSAMIGGLFTKASHRGEGMASYLISTLCEKIKSENKVPCLISTAPIEQNLFYKLGFEKVEDFTTLEPIR